ncbi:MAG: hypothetical protein ACI867_000038 [Glaciecola sp.]|jgi:hypothetical protein
MPEDDERPAVLSVEDLDVDPRGGRVYTWIGAAFVVICLVVVPFLTGPLAMVFGTLGHVKRDPWGIRVAVAGGVAMVVSMALQAVVFGSGGIAA